MGELVAYRDLLWVLAARDLKVRYKQTAIGAAWAVLQPFLTMVVFTVFFGLLGRYPSSGDIPYATGQVLKIDGGMTVRRL